MVILFGICWLMYCFIDDSSHHLSHSVIYSISCSVA